MKLTLRLLLLSLILTLTTACSEDETTNPLLGTWQLEAWSIGIPFDVLEDGTSDFNFLNSTQCEVAENLIFDSNGVVTSKDTFNPEITISLVDDAPDQYLIDEICSEGSIGFSSSYEQPELQRVLFNNGVGYLDNKKLTMVFKNAIDIYNESQTEVIDKKDLTLTYISK